MYGLTYPIPFPKRQKKLTSRLGNQYPFSPKAAHVTSSCRMMEKHICFNNLKWANKPIQKWWDSNWQSNTCHVTVWRHIFTSRWHRLNLSSLPQILLKGIATLPSNTASENTINYNPILKPRVTINLVKDEMNQMAVISILGTWHIQLGEHFLYKMNQRKIAHLQITIPTMRWIAISVLVKAKKATSSPSLFLTSQL